MTDPLRTATWWRDFGARAQLWLVDYPIPCAAAEGGATRYVVTTLSAPTPWCPDPPVETAAHPADHRARKISITALVCVPGHDHEAAIQALGWRIDPDPDYQPPLWP